MVIREMSRDECLGVLAESRLCRLGCSHEGQPYVVPVYLAYHASSGCMYGFTTLGQKVEWMRANPLVCIEVDESAGFGEWMSVIANGRYEELPAASAAMTLGTGAAAPAPARSELSERGQSAAAAAAGGVIVPTTLVEGGPRRGDDDAGHEAGLAGAEAVTRLPGWWQPGSAVWASRAHRDPAAPFIAIFYRIRIGEVTGHAATPDGAKAAAGTAPPRRGWLDKTVKRLLRRGRY